MGVGTGKRILLPISDLVFKLIFGSESNIDILTAFLQSVLDLPAEEYDKVSIADTHLQREAADDKLGVLDVLISTKSGKLVNVEIQVESHSQMRERALFYASKLITRQMKSGYGYGRIKQVVSIIITDYTLIAENGNYHNRFMLYDPKTSTRFTDLMQINTLELTKLPQNTDASKLWNWLRFFRAKQKEEFEMIANADPKIHKAVGVLMKLSEDEQAQMIYDYRERQRFDDIVRLNDAIEEGVRRGNTEGMQKGIQEGRQEGRQEIARNMLDSKMPISDIMRFTGLSSDEIEKLMI